MTQSPAQVVKKQFGTKEKLVESLLSTLAKKDGESKEDFKKRLLQVSSRKLLRLSRRRETPKPAKKG